MGLGQRLRRLDDHAFGGGPLLPAAVAAMLSAVPAAGGGRLARFHARWDFAATRSRPDPRRAAASGAFVVTVNVAIAVMYGVILGRESSWFVLGIGVLWLPLLAVAVAKSVHGYRFSVVRAAAIYGPDWRQLSAADRMRRWRDYCQHWQDWARIAAPSWGLATDASDPYTTPTLAQSPNRGF